MSPTNNVVGGARLWAANARSVIPEFEEIPDFGQFGALFGPQSHVPIFKSPEIGMMQVNQHHASCGSNGKPRRYNESAMRSRQRIPLCLAGFLFGWKVIPRRIQKSAACPLLRSMHHENRIGLSSRLVPRTTPNSAPRSSAGLFAGEMSPVFFPLEYQRDQRLLNLNAKLCMARC